MCQIGRDKYDTIFLSSKILSLPLIYGVIVFMGITEDIICFCLYLSLTCMTSVSHGLCFIFIFACICGLSLLSPWLSIQHMMDDMHKGTRGGHTQSLSIARTPGTGF